MNVLKIYAANGTLDILHTLSAEHSQCGFIHIYIRGNDIHHHGHLHHQLEHRRAVRFSDASTAPVTAEVMAVGRNLVASPAEIYPQ